MIVDCAIYERGQRRDGTLSLEDASHQRDGDRSFVWIGLHEPTPEEFDSVRREFNLHELPVEDAIKAHQRPKLELYESFLFVVLKTARYANAEEQLEVGEILIFLGDGFIITVRHGEAGLHDVRERLEGRPELLSRGPSAALHAIMDRVVDDYAPALADLENDVEEVEVDVFSPGRSSPVRRIFMLKREVLEFIRATAPLVEPVDRLARGHYEQVHPEVRTYFRDVADHIVRIHEQLEGLREVLTSILTANLTQVSVQQNEDVRKISAWVAILAVPTMIAGIYGMNFEDMPELKWAFGYPLVMAVMAAICLSLYRYFKRAGWL